MTAAGEEREVKILGLSLSTRALNKVEEEKMPVMQQCPPDHPLMKAWTAYQQTEDFQNSYRWATAGIEPPEQAERDPTANYPTADTYRQYTLGSLWAAFMAGFNAAMERAALLHESVNPASDDERLNKVPGAGAMGAVIEYRDTIRRG